MIQGVGAKQSIRKRFPFENRLLSLMLADNKANQSIKKRFPFKKRSCVVHAVKGNIWGMEPDPGRQIRPSKNGSRSKNGLLSIMLLREWLGQNCNATQAAMQKKLQRKKNCNAKETATVTHTKNCSVDKTATQHKLQCKRNCNAKRTAMQKKLQCKRNCNAKKTATQNKLQCKQNCNANKSPPRRRDPPRSSHHHLP